MSDGSVKAWGNNADGQLGDGTTTNRTTPVTVSGLGAGSGVTSPSPPDIFTRWRSCPMARSRPGATTSTGNSATAPPMTVMRR
ncbi:MAG: hypothetical protein U0841_07225 [Chloroflexia bacterium]